MLSKNELIDRVKDDLLPAHEAECLKLERIDRWYRWDPEEIRLPRAATAELKALRDLSRVPWLGLVVTSTAQCMFVDGYRSALDPADKADDAPQPSGPWKIWQSNRWNVRQAAVHRSMLAYGYAYATVLPGQDQITGDSMPVLRGVSPRRMWAVYDDPAEDDFPEIAMRVMSDNRNNCTVKVYDAEFVYTLVRNKTVTGGQDAYTVTTQRHDAGVTPVVRYCNQLDLEGRTPGEIEPHIPIAARINKTSYDRLLVQHFNSWKVRYVTGMAQPDTDEAAIRKAMELRIQDLLVSEDPTTKFGTLDETQMTGFISAHEADVETLAAVTQTPTHELTGKLINVSAEGLAMIRASQQQKVYERQQSAGASHAQLLRLASAITGDAEHAEDVTGRVTWQDTSIRSLAQSVAALGQAAQLLNIPVTELWGRIPGVEKADVQEWKAVYREQDPINQLAAQMDRQAAPVTPPPADVVPGQ